MRIATNTLIPWIALLALAPVITLAAEQEPDWWEAQRELNAKLLEQKTPLTDLAVAAADSKPATGKDAMFKLAVLLRAGMERQAIAALSELKGLCPNLNQYKISNIYFDACDNLHAWGVAQAAVEIFADRITELELQNRLLKHLLETGWTVEQVDAWLAARPKGVQWFWIKQRLRFNFVQGRGEALLDQLTADVKKRSEDISAAVNYLDALRFARDGRKFGLAWMGETFKPAKATEAHDLASKLRELDDNATAVVFYQKAVSIPLTDDEVRKMSVMRQVFIPEATLKAGFAAQVRGELARCLLVLGRNAEAQKWMVEAADIREKNKLRPDSFLAGEVQGASGQRVIEGRIKEAEKKSEQNPEYWRERAQYYRGRKESAQEEEALKKGLGLTKPQPKPERASKGYADMRGRLLTDYAHFLQREKRVDEAVALLRKELADAPANTESAHRAAYLLAFDFEKRVNPDDEVLWNWLARRPKWEYTEQRLLWRMLQNSPGEKLEDYFKLAEQLAQGADPTRAYELGWVLNRMNFAARSIPLLQNALEKGDKVLKEKAAFTLLESYLDTADWKNAERLFSEASRRLTAFETPEWYGRIALAAAQAGAQADALRIWRRAANVNPTPTSYVERLARLGLREELAGFYREMQVKLPTSDIPKRALKMLGEN